MLLLIVDGSRGQALMRKSGSHITNLRSGFNRRVALELWQHFSGSGLGATMLHRMDQVWAPPCFTEVECLLISQIVILSGRSTMNICVIHPSGAKYGLAHALQVIKEGSGGL